MLKSGASCQIVINFTATPAAAYAQTLKLNYHDGAFNKILSVDVTAVARPIADNITPVPFDEDLQSGTITLAYNAGPSTNATTCALSSLTNVTVTQGCACVIGVCTVKVTGTANYFGAAGFGYTVTANGAVSNIATAAFTINSINDNPVLTVPNNRSYPLDGTDEPILQGTQYTFTSSTTDVENDPITYSCTYATPTLGPGDDNYAAPATACTSLPSLMLNAGVLLPGTATFSTSTSALVWQPTNRQKGTYEFTVTATDSNAGADTETFYVTVRESYTTANLLAAYDATYSYVTYIPRLSGSGGNDDTTDWLDLTLNDITASLAGFTTAAPWAGVGIYSNPYRLTFNGTNDSMSVDAVLGANTKMLFNTWINPGSAASKDKIILSNGGGSGSGFVLQQSQSVAGKIELAVGLKSYSDLILADAPVGYWRLTETGGTTATDSSVSAQNGTYVNSPALGQPGPLATGSTASAYFDGSQAALGENVKYVNVPSTAALSPTGQVSLEAWVKKTIGNSAHYLRKGGDYLLDSEGVNAIRFTVSSNYGIGTGAFPDDGLWHHVAGTYDGSNLRVYVDGVLKQTTAYAGAITTSGSPLHLGARSDLWISNLKGNMAEAAVYNYALSPGQISAHYDAGSGIFYPNNILAWQPSAFWRFDEKAGSTLVDLSPNANHGTYAGTYTLNAPGALGNDTNSATLFQSAGVTIPEHASLSSATKFSLAFWFKPNSIPVGFGETILTKWGGGGAATVNYVLYYYGDTSGGDGWLRLHANAGGAYTEITSYVIPPLNTWTHIAMTYDSTSNGIIYVNGSQVNSIAAPGILATNNGPVSINKSNGSLDEFAIFNYVLTAKQVAQIYSSGSFSKCQSETTFANGAWKFVSGLWDGNALSLFVNGREECKITPPSATFSPGASPNISVAAGPANSKNWQGSIADLKIFGASGTGSAGSANSVKNDFIATANQFRATAAPEIVSSGLLFNLDAAYANQGMGAHGCAGPAPNPIWSDLSNSLGDGLLNNFPTCTTYGWQGAGIPADPYRLVYNVAALSAVTTSNLVGLSGSFSFELWINPASLGDYYQVFGSYGGWGTFQFHSNATGAVYCGTDVVKRFDPTEIPAGTLVVGQWAHLVYTYNLSTGMGSFYKNGALIAGPKAQDASTPWGSFTIGTTTSNTVSGSLAKVAVYNTALTLAQIKQNCEALEGRFLGFTCN